MLVSGDAPKKVVFYFLLKIKGDGQGTLCTYSTNTEGSASSPQRKETRIYWIPLHAQPSRKHLPPRRSVVSHGYTATAIPVFRRGLLTFRGVCSRTCLGSWKTRLGVYWGRASVGKREGPVGIH